MKLLIGLGNPGLEYASTRHNAGFMAIDALAHRHAPGGIARSKFQGACLDADIGGEKCLLIKPNTYMNRSGQCVAEAVRFYKLTPSEDVLVFVDEAALDVGEIRVRGEGGAGGHNGLADIAQKLGTQAYPRLRIGVGPRPKQIILHDFVLGKFLPEERDLLPGVMEKAADAAECFVGKGLETTMNRFNVRPAKPKPAKPEPVKEDSTEPQTAPGVSGGAEPDTEANK